MIRALSEVLRPYRGRCVALGGVLLAASFLEGVTLAAFLPVFLTLLNPSALGQVVAGPIHGVARLIGLLSWGDPVLASCLLLAAVFLVRSLVIMAREALLASLGGRVLHDMTVRVITAYTRMPYEMLTGEPQGVLLYDALTAPSRAALAAQRVPQLAAEALKITAITSVLLALFPRATLFVFASAVLYFVGMRRLVTTLAYDTGIGRTAAHVEQGEIAHQLLGGMRQLTVYQATERWLARFRTASERYRRLYTTYLTWMGAPRQLMELVLVLGVLGAIAAGRLAAPNEIGSWLPGLGMFAMALMQIFPSLTALGRLAMELREAEPDVERLQARLAQAVPSAVSGGRPFQQLTQGIVFDHVTFRYAGRPPALHDITVTLLRGRITAIAGVSGAGKTTLINLLLGLCQPTEGRVLLDGVPLDSYDLASWQRRVGFVSQDPFLFHGTIRDNILFGRSGHTEADVIRAAQAAGASVFIGELPEGYETIVGERGAKLSGGQQQRIAIARALLGSPDILVLDEATSALDPESERMVQATVGGLAKSLTIMLITHGEQMLSLADQVVVLHGGRVMECRARDMFAPQSLTLEAGRQ